MNNRGNKDIVVRQRKVATAIAVFTVTSILVLFQNCSSHDSEPQINQAALLFEQTSAQAKSILGAKCANCHVFVTDPNELEAAGWIDIGNPEDSRMYIDIVDQFEPREGDPLTDEEMQWVRDWIALLDDNWETVIPPPPVDGNGEILEFGTYSYVVAVVFRARCATCHLNGAQSGGLDLGNYNQVRNRANSGELMDRLNSVNDADRMPPPGADPNDVFPLPSELQAVQAWVDRGAPND